MGVMYFPGYQQLREVTRVVRLSLDDAPILEPLWYAPGLIPLFQGRVVKLTAAATLEAQYRGPGRPPRLTETEVAVEISGVRFTAITRPVPCPAGMETSSPEYARHCYDRHHADGEAVSKALQAAWIAHQERPYAAPDLGPAREALAQLLADMEGLLGPDAAPEAADAAREVRARTATAIHALSALDGPLAQLQAAQTKKPAAPEHLKAHTLGHRLLWLFTHPDVGPGPAGKFVLCCMPDNAAENTEQALGQLVERGLVWFDRGTFRLTDAGRAEAEHLGAFTYADDAPAPESAPSPPQDPKVELWTVKRKIRAAMRANDTALSALTPLNERRAALQWEVHAQELRQHGLFPPGSRVTWESFGDGGWQPRTGRIVRANLVHVLGGRPDADYTIVPDGPPWGAVLITHHAQDGRVVRNFGLEEPAHE